MKFEMSVNAFEKNDGPMHMLRYFNIINTTYLTYENYTANYKNFPGAPIKFQEIYSISRSSRGCRHPTKPDRLIQESPYQNVWMGQSGGQSRK